MLRKGMTEADVKKAVGWKPNSAMLARYSHLTETDSRNAYLRASGLKVADAPRVEPFSVPTKDVPPVVAAPPSVVDLSDPRLQGQLDKMFTERMRIEVEKMAGELRSMLRAAGNEVVDRPLTDEEAAKGKDAPMGIWVSTKKK
jgi:hypothetical protein